MSDIDIIKSKINIVDLVREYVPDLKKAGRNWTARSPFRQEKTPSFMVNEELGIFKDFGGDKAGDIFKFIQEMEGLNFRESLEFLAKKAGVELKNNTSTRNERDEQLKRDIININNLATEVFHFILVSHKLGKSALKYCLDRGLDLQTIKEYKIGYAPQKLRLDNFIEKKLGFKSTDSAVTSSGLFVEKQGQLVDKFNDRLMFNIKNNKGEIVAFSGRIVHKDDNRPKYINSPETLIYRKSEILFNFYQAKSDIKSQDFVILTEGQIDTISSSKVGVRNIVAPLGTSLTIEQLQIIKRYTNHLVLALDNDSAGEKASDRAFELASQLKLKVWMLDLNSETRNNPVKDIDELVQKNPEAWIRVSNSRIAFIEFQITRLSKRYHLEDIQEKRRFIEEILVYISKLQDKIEQVSYIQKLSQIVNISEDLLLAELENLRSKTSRSNTHLLRKEQLDVIDSRDTSIDNQKEDRRPTEIALTEVEENVSYDPKELYLLALIYNFDEVQNFFNLNLRSKINSSFLQTIDIKYLEKPDELLSNPKLAEEVAFLKLPEDEIDSMKEFKKVFQLLEINFKKRQLLELANKVGQKENIDEQDTSNEDIIKAQEILKSIR